ncbi:MAG: hypothetical protein HKN45_09250, partial [Flavobacteriales bacterium]|nr:hypothetical protein [Flavobacteriales bacterium]
MILRSFLAVLLAALSSASFSQLSDCEPIFSTTVLEVNRIRARVGTPNVFFKNWGDAGFAVPAEDSVHSIYAHIDWIGGLTADGSLHLAAGTYNSGGGSDFFTGPLSNDGAAMTEEELCESYSGLYHAKRIDALVHQE